MQNIIEVLVIGGGVSGLVAANEAADQGQSVTIVAPNDWGGVIRTKYESGFTLECGPNVLIAKPALINLLRKLNLTDRMVAPRIPKYSQLIWYQGRAQRAPRSFFDLLFTPLLGLGDKVRLLPKLLSRDLLIAREDESVAEFFRRLIGDRGVKTFLGAVLKGIYAGDVEKLSARSIFPGLWEAFNSNRGVIDYLKARRASGARGEIFVLRGGMSELVLALRAMLKERATFIEGMVRTVSRDSDYFVVRTDTDEILARQVIVATSGGATAAYIGSLDNQFAERLRKMAYASLVVVHVEIAASAPLPPRSFGVLFPDEQESKLLGVMFNSELFPHLAPVGKHLLTVCLGGVDSEEILRQDDETLTNLVAAELKEKLCFEGTKLLSITRWPRVIPQYELGHFRLVDGMRQLEKKYPGLRFIGADSGGVGVPDRVKVALGDQ